MIEREHEQLIQDVLDGQATPAQAERLKAWLSTNEEGRTRMRELESLFATLDRVPFAELPEGLANEVEQAIRARAASRGAAVGRLPAGGFAPRMRLGVVFAAGIAAGVIGWGALTGVLNPGAPGRERVVGSMMPAAAARAGAVQGAWKAGQARVEGVTWRVGKARWVTVQVRSGEPVEIELRFDPGALSPAAVRQSDPAARVVVDAGRIVLGSPAAGEFSVEFGEQGVATPIQVTVRAGEASAAGELPAPRSPGRAR